MVYSADLLTSVVENIAQNQKRLYFMILFLTIIYVFVELLITN